MKLGTFSKQPEERLSQSVVYTDALDVSDGLSLVSACTVTPTGLLASPALVSEERVRLWVSGGDDGVTYKITLIVQTAGGEIFEDELTCKVKSL